jgi:tripartite-type tricarboxylate transporter receptor subunit TctC
MDTLHKRITQALALAEVGERLGSIGFERIGSTPDFFAERLKAESIEWGRVVREAKIGAD